MISDLVSVGIKKGFSSVEVSQEKIVNAEFIRSGDKISEHSSKLQKIHCRSMYDYGDPVTFSISESDKKSVSAAFGMISKTLPSSGKENFRKLVPKEVDKVRIEIYDPRFDNTGSTDFRELIDGIDENILNFPGLKLNTVSFTKLKKKLYLLNSRGLDAKYRKTLFSVSVNMSLKENSIELSDNRIFFQNLELFKLVSRGYTLLDSLTDNAPELKKFNDLIFSPESASVILKVFSKYFFPEHYDIACKVNYPGVLNISDDPLLDYGVGSVPFDDEGVQKGETEIIRRGIFQSSISDLRTSLISNIKPTGNGFRRGGDHPSTNFTNLFIKPSVISVNNILKDIPEAVLISLVKLITSKNGENIFSAYGYRYNNGERGEPVHFFISTTFQNFLLNIERISKEIRFFYSGNNTGSPYLLVKSKRTGDRLVRI